VLLGIYITLFNNYVVYKQFTAENYYVSVAPIFGGVVFSLGLYINPYYDFSYYVLIPLLVDLGCIPYVLSGVIGSLYLTLMKK